MSTARRAGLVVLAVAAFLALAAVQRRALPWPREFGLRAKVEHLARSGARYDVLVVGSSRTYRGVDPAALDAAAAQAGHPVRSFNLALPGMTMFEADRLLRHVLDEGLARPRVALIEALPWEAGEDWARNAFSARSVQWHTPAHTALAIAALGREPRTSTARRLALAFAHVRAAAWALSSHGQGPRWLGADADPYAPDARTIARGAGFVALEDASRPSVPRRHAAFLADPGAYAAHLRRVTSPRAGAGRAAGYALGALRAQQRALAAHGVRSVYFTTPTTFAVGWAEVLADAGHLPDLLAHHGPSRVPELYEPQVRFDREHLDREGARRFSERLGRALARTLGAPRPDEGR